jgi:hypothetical protein
MSNFQQQPHNEATVWIRCSTWAVLAVSVVAVIIRQGIADQACYQLYQVLFTRDRCDYCLFLMVLLFMSLEFNMKERLKMRFGVF